ncbi:MAG: hypothetical protein COA69_09505 [Robiginitomaculum sp.]|nr:MAG: hypothetical protein COA69_09505 [Robiginitomaculum sp.]
MRPIEFPQQSGVLGRGVNHDSVIDLPVHQCRIPVGEGFVPANISCWKLAPDEIAAFTGVIWLSVWGTSQPPLNVSAHSPFETEPRGSVLAEVQSRVEVLEAAGSLPEMDGEREDMVTAAALIIMEIKKL